MVKKMPKIVQSKPQVVNTMKRVKEEIVRFACPENTIGIGESQELQLYEGAGADYYTVRIGEGVELLALGTDSFYQDDGGTPPVIDSYLDELVVQDWNGSEWNKFHIVPEQYSLVNSNELPFNNPMNFERKMMSWGYKSFLTSSTDVAPTLKLPEGDKLRIFVRNSTNSASALDLTNETIKIPTSAIVRRYLAGSNIDYKHFDQYDGGIKSTKRYYNDYQTLAITDLGQYTDAWNLTIIRNEAYKFFQAGVVSINPRASTQVNAKILIDDPLTEYNKYWVAPGYNHLPFTDTYSIYEPIAGGVDAHAEIEKTHRFAPTIDIIKNRNKDLKLKVRDNGTTKAENLVTRFYGVRYIL